MHNISKQKKQCVVVGAGNAAAQFVLSLRLAGWQNNILLIGDEPNVPYHRPPLSKAYLSNEMDDSQLAIRPQEFYEKQNIETLFSCKISSIDCSQKVLYTDKGEAILYDKLCLATGTRARKLKGIKNGDSKNIYYLRNKKDVDNIKATLGSTKNIAIVGGGYIGLEVCASLTKLGKKITILETTDRVLQRVTAPQMSHYFSQLHQSKGASIITGVNIAEFVTEKQNIRAIKLTDGTQILADIVIIGIGVEVNDELAIEANLKVENGIVVDDYCQTSDENIYAIGDCTNHYSHIYQRRIRLESVPNAIKQAKIAAHSIVGQPSIYNSLPWFWSDQYDIKLQIAGISQNYEQTQLIGDMNENKFCLYYLKSDKVIAVDAINSPRAFMQAKKIIINNEGLP